MRFSFTTSHQSQLRLSTFPLAYEVKYQHLQDGLESEDFLCSGPENSISPDVRTSFEEAPRVSHRSLEASLSRSKCVNSSAGTACFETYKSLKVLSLVCAYMRDEE
eukprot:TRINITY_DN6338_c0_g1_i2.p1 TRINITY_DN6338_c0_g1~~TRINITY_DN6338_c0_g1_i2.p1  ORF type:complete len:106 (-),score=1.17 TRINITY_DN6338_c0_g1_i2:22-339(-)